MGGGGGEEGHGPRDTEIQLSSPLTVKQTPVYLKVKK